MQLISAKDLVAAARGRVENLSDEQVAAELDRDDVVVIDLREEDERSSQGTIPGALHVPRGLLEFSADPSLPSHRNELDPERRVVLYCKSGGRSALAAATLQEMGFRDVAHLDGGFESWRLAGRPIEIVETVA
jgi:rhodanese-related sulfurtransferase